MNQDDVDTAPVFTEEVGHVEFCSASIKPGERATLDLRVQEPARSHTLFASSDPRDDRLVIEEVSCEGVRVSEGEEVLESLRFGRKLSVKLAEGVTLRVTVRNDSDQETRVGVSLVSADLVDDK